MGKNKNFNKGKKQDNLLHFRLVHHSGEENPNDSSKPKLVLEQFLPPNEEKKTNELPDLPEGLEALGHQVFPHLPQDEESLVEGACRVKEGVGNIAEEELEGDCYFPKDGYDYDQHLKRVGGGGTVLKADPLEVEMNLPLKPIVKQTQDESEALEALEAEWGGQDGGYEELEDGEWGSLMKGGPTDEAEVLWAEKTESREVVSKEHQQELDDLLADDLFSDTEEVTGPQAAGGSADAKLAAMLDEYDDDEIGALDEPEEQEDVDREKAVKAVETLAEEHIEEQEDEQAFRKAVFEPLTGGKLDDEPRPLEKTKELALRICNEDSDDDPQPPESEAKDTWDCESILSTLSNNSNHPGKVIRPKKIKKIRPAVETVKEGNEDEEDESSDDENDGPEVVNIPDASNERPKDETPEERRVRKAAVKELRRVCRRMKKETKETYKKEGDKIKGVRQGGQADVRQEVRVFRL